MRRAQGGMRAKERHELVSEIAQIPRGGAASIEISDCELLESSFTEHGAEPGKIVAKICKETPPILLVVDFEPFECAQAVIRLDDLSGIREGGALHAIPGAERSHDRLRHERLHRGKRIEGRRAGRDATMPRVFLRREGNGWL